MIPALLFGFVCALALPLALCAAVAIGRNVGTAVSNLNGRRHRRNDRRLPRSFWGEETQ